MFKCLGIGYIGMLGRLFVLFMLINWPVYAQYEVNFTPSLSCEQKIVELINESQQSVDAAVYSINNDKIVQALKDADKRGVKVRVLTDKSQAGQKSSKAIDMYQSGLDVRVNSAHKLEHNKFAVFDGNKVVTGSYNWTNPATDKNSENCLFILEQNQVVTDYQNRFNELWQKNQQEKSDEWMMKKIYQ